MKTKVFFAALAVSALALTPAIAGSSAPLAIGDFPSAGEYVIHSKPTFLITVGETKEVVECDATLVVRATDPYITAAGSKRVDLTVVDWKADGKSVLLDGALHFRMVQGVEPSDLSYVESYQLAGTHDFPAQAQFAVPYEVETPFGTLTGLHGVTRGSIKQFPPSGDIFLMEKGDIGDMMAELMPAPLSQLSAAGEETTGTATIEPVACACPSALSN